MQYKVYRNKNSDKADYIGDNWQQAIDCWSYWTGNKMTPVIKVYESNNPNQMLLYVASTQRCIHDWSTYLHMNRIERRIAKETGLITIYPEDDLTDRTGNMEKQPDLNHEEKIDFHGNFNDMSNKEQDAIINPKHYKMIPKEAYAKFPNGLEYIDLMEYILKQHKGVEAHLLGHIFKYAMRLGKKDASLQDAKKIEWYANRLVEVIDDKQRNS